VVAVSFPVLVVVGSRTSVARQQTRVLASNGVHHFTVSSQLLSARGEGVPRWVEEIQSVIDHGQDVVVSIAGSETSTRDDDRLPRRLGKCLEPFSRKIGGLVLTGGDTARGVLDAWGVSALHLIGEFGPGVPVARGEGSADLVIVTKAGGFGTADVLLTAVRRLRPLPYSPTVT
jgi:4-hydroxythreonine-4-phosphate dehydrogenase